MPAAIASLRQAVTGRHIPFQRTPKVEGRTATPWTMLLAIWFAPAFLLLGAANDITDGAFLRATLAGGNGILMAAAAIYFVGIRASLEDLRGLGESWKTKTRVLVGPRHRRLGHPRAGRALPSTTTRAGHLHSREGGSPLPVEITVATGR